MELRFVHTADAFFRTILFLPGKWWRKASSASHVSRTNC